MNSQEMPKRVERNRNAGKEGEKGMRLFEDHAVCGECQKKGGHNHSMTKFGVGVGHTDCPNYDTFSETGDLFQCVCGTEGILENGAWKSFE